MDSPSAGLSVERPVAVPDESPAQARVKEQIAWYDAKSQHNQRWFKRLKILQIVTAAAIPVAASLKASIGVAAVAGGLIVVLEGLQQLQQYQQNWTTYRSTCEKLKHEHFLYMAHAGPYAGAIDPDAVLAEQIEGLVSQEHAAWSSHRDEANRQGGGKA